MIIFGNSSEKQVGCYELLNSDCPKCQNRESLIAIGLLRYAHLYWIPMFPTGKRVLSTCIHCKYTMTVKEAPDSIAEQMQTCKEDIRFPWYYWIGLGLIGLMVVIILLKNIL